MHSQHVPLVPPEPWLVVHIPETTPVEMAGLQETHLWSEEEIKS